MWNDWGQKGSPGFPVNEGLAFASSRLKSPPVLPPPPTTLYFNSQCFICWLPHFFFPLLHNVVHGDCFPYNPYSTTTLPDTSATWDYHAATNISTFCTCGGAAACSQKEENVSTKKSSIFFPKSHDIFLPAPWMREGELLTEGEKTK